MSTQTESAHGTESPPGNWRAGTLAGIAGGIAMGVLVIAMNPPTIAVAIPSLYGLAPPPTPGVGMVVHVSHGAVLGVAFAGIAGAVGVDSDAKVVGLGVGWGVVTWAVLAALVMPLWLSAVGSPASPPLPNFAPPSLLWHVVYGLVLGGVYVAIEDAV
ncbi:histidine kinase [Halobaculum magnesiiphilum]|uniref:Histidine kinase n=1 Tax=Halobaculum magnesiiphilum TaxID=1017351 RepID=A0A8T8WAK7_9EURY|nr:histidine kinase [Halobaculum magnesiiphilum]QZP36870.1 histidine kinase [Halobaculum magnesiiphilum]